MKRIALVVLLCGMTGMGAATQNGEKKDEKKDDKKVEIYIVEVLLPPTKPERLKKGTVEIVIETEKDRGYPEKTMVKNVKKVADDAPKEGAVYVQGATAKWSVVKAEPSRIFILTPERLKVGTKLIGRYRGLFQADALSSGGKWGFFEATIQK